MKTRIQWIDIAKGLGIVLVIIGHSGAPDIIRKYIYGFHMPLFFIISGYLYNTPKNGRLKELIIKKSRCYLMPYFILCTINLALNIFCESLSIRGNELWLSTAKHILGILIGVSTNNLMPNCTPLWFLPCIFLSTLYLYFLLTFKKKPVQILMCLCGLCIVSLLRFINAPQLPWHFDTAIMGSILMLIGHEIKYRKLLTDNKLKPLYVCLLFIVGIIFISINISIKKIDMNNNIYGDFAFMFCGSISISYVFMWICSHIKECAIISFIGRGTIIVMGFNYFFNTVIRFIWRHIPKAQEEHCPWWLLSIATTILCYCTIYMWNLLQKYILNHMNPPHE